MPRRALLWLTALVLGLHWLVLAAVPLQQHAPVAQGAPLFSTRTLAAPAPAPVAPIAPAPLPPAAALPPATPVPQPRRAPVRKAPAQKPPAAADTPASASAAAHRAGPAPWDAGALAPEEDGGDAPELAAQELATASDVTDDSHVTDDSDGSDLGAPPEALAAAPGADTLAAAAPAPAPTLPAPPAPADPEADTPRSVIDIERPGAVARSGANAAPPVQIPPPRRLQFDVSGQAKTFHYSARAELLWQHDGAHYQARQEISLLLLGARTQTSSGALDAGGLRPQRFGDRARSEQAAHFDYAQGQVTFSANTPAAALLPGTQDRLSVFIQLGALLAAAPEHYPTGTTIRLATVGARAADVWAFTVQDEETLDLPIGALAALKLQRLPRREHEHDQKAELWLAPTLGYLPVRIRITQANGDFADLRLRSQAPP